MRCALDCTTTSARSRINSVRSSRSGAFTDAGIGRPSATSGCYQPAVLIHPLVQQQNRVRRAGWSTSMLLSRRRAAVVATILE